VRRSLERRKKKSSLLVRFWGRGGSFIRIYVKGKTRSSTGRILKETMALYLVTPREKSSRRQKKKILGCVEEKKKRESVARERWKRNQSVRKHLERPPKKRKLAPRPLQKKGRARCRSRRKDMKVNKSTTKVDGFQPRK